jgi:hypothetical protein
MSVPPELLQQMMSGGGAGASPPGGVGSPPGGAQPPSAMPGPGGPAAAAAQMPGAKPPGQSPAAGPMSTPQDKRGLKAAAQTNIHIAVNMLEEALPAFGSESPEGAKVIKALNILASMVAKKDTSDLVPAEILQMVRRLPQMGGGTQVQQQIMKQMAQAKQQPAPAA